MLTPLLHFVFYFIFMLFIASVLRQRMLLRHLLRVRLSTLMSLRYALFTQRRFADITDDAFRLLCRLTNTNRTTTYIDHHEL